MSRQRVTLATYIAGYSLSIGLTLMAFQIVSDGDFVGWTLILVLMGLAVAQLVVQLVFFLHLDQEERPRWNFMVFLFMGLVLLIVVIGSLWIMENLDRYHGPTPQEASDYLLEDEGIKPE